MLSNPVRLTPADAARYVRLRLRMLADAPWAFAASPDDDIALDRARLVDLLGEDQNAIFAMEAAKLRSQGSGGAQESYPPELIAAAGIWRMKQSKFAHRAKLWGVFVEPEHRGKGLGRSVVRASILA
jgi:GNAT superfamily N-acetyltransferase